MTDLAIPVTDLEDDRDILVVDDEAAIRDMVAMFLRRLGFRVETAADGQSALDKLRASRYFLVISDVGMPGISGMDLLSSVKELARSDDPAPTDVIIVTGK